MCCDVARIRHFVNGNLMYFPNLLVLTTTGRSGFDPRQRQRIFFCILCVHTGSGAAHPTSYPMGTGVPFPGGKARLGRGADNSPSSSAQVKHDYELYFLSPQARPWSVVGLLYFTSYWSLLVVTRVWKGNHGLWWVFWSVLLHLWWSRNKTEMARVSRWQWVDVCKSTIRGMLCSSHLHGKWTRKTDKYYTHDLKIVTTELSP
jgi:hypothetical protein